MNGVLVLREHVLCMMGKKIEQRKEYSIFPVDSERSTLIINN